MMWKTRGQFAAWKQSSLLRRAPPKALGMTITSSWQRKSGTQNGYVMLGLIVILGIAALTIFVSRLNATAIHNDQARKTTSALAVAKQALIASAAASNTRPGALPCPDTEMLDAAWKRPWYVLSPNFQYQGITHSFWPAVAWNETQAATH